MPSQDRTQQSTQPKRLDMTMTNLFAMGVETNYFVMLLMLSHYGSTSTCQIVHTLLIFPCLKTVGKTLTNWSAI